MAINLPIISKFNDAGVKAAEGALGKFGRFAAQTSAAAAAAIGGIAVVSIQKFAEFDDKLNQSIAIMGNVSDAMRTDMSDAAREVAKTTTFSAEQAAESFFFLASAGLDAASSIEAMPQVAKFAQAGMFDMAQATDLLTDAQSALGLTIRDDAVKNMENMSKVSDVLVKANTLANASVEQFSTALTTKAGPAMRAVGMDVEEGVAVLAAFADQGIKGEEAGTNFGIVLRDLQTKAIKNKDAFAEAGVAVFDASGEFNNMGDIVADLEGLLNGMSDETKKATLSQLGFSDKSMASISALLGMSDAIKGYEGELRNAGGTTDEVSEKQLESFKSQMELLKSRLEDVAIEIGGTLAPKLQLLMDRIAPIIDQAAPVLIGMFDKIWAAAENIGTWVSPLVERLLPALQTIFETLIDPITKVFDVLKALAEKVLTAVTDLVTNKMFQDAMAFMGEAFGKVATQVEKLVKSPLVDFLLNIAGKAIVGGITILATALEGLAAVLNAVNQAIDLLSGKSVPDLSVGGVGGYTTPKKTTSYNPYNIPKFATGGIVMPSAGGTLGVIGEAGQAEAVIPLSRLDSMLSGNQSGSNFNITVNAGMGADGSDIGRKIVDAIIRYERSSGKVFARA